MANEAELVPASVYSMPPWMKQLRDAVDAEIKPDDLQGIVRAFVDKAKLGDERAARFVIEYLMGGKLAPINVTVNNFHGSDGQVVQMRPAVGGISPVRDRIFDYLSQCGTATVAAIRSDLGLSLEEVQEALTHEWFTKIRNRYAIATSGGRGLISDE